MNCKTAKRSIYRWLDKELEPPLLNEFEEHLTKCTACRKDTDSIRRFTAQLRTAPLLIEPSADFDAIFWRKVWEHKERPWFFRLVRDLEVWVPAPTWAQAAAVVLIAFLVGGTGGVVSAVQLEGNVGTPWRVAPTGSMPYLSGFPEYKGVPFPSLAASYLKASDERKHR